MRRSRERPVLVGVAAERVHWTRLPRAEVRHAAQPRRGWDRAAAAAGIDVWVNGAMAAVLGFVHEASRELPPRNRGHVSRLRRRHARCTRAHARATAA